MKRVAGIGLDGSNVTTTFGKVEAKTIKATYGDTLSPEWLTYMGNQEQDEQTDGTYSTDEVTISFSAVVFRTIVMPAFPITGAGNVRIPIVVTRAHSDLGSDSDLLEMCRCVNWAASVENSATVEVVETKWTTKQIRWTDRRITINRLAGVEPGANGF